MAFLVYNFETKVLSTRDKKEEINLDEEMYVGLEDKDDEFYVMQVDGVDIIGDYGFQPTTMNEFDEIVNSYYSRFNEGNEGIYKSLFSSPQCILDTLNIEKTTHVYGSSNLCSFSLYKINRIEGKPCFK